LGNEKAQLFIDMGIVQSFVKQLIDIGQKVSIC
jgi:hypothetical protein